MLRTDGRAAVSAVAAAENKLVAVLECGKVQVWSGERLGKTEVAELGRGSGLGKFEVRWAESGDEFVVARKNVGDLCLFRREAGTWRKRRPLLECRVIGQEEVVTAWDLREANLVVCLASGAVFWIGWSFEQELKKINERKQRIVCRFRAKCLVKANACGVAYSKDTVLNHVYVWFSYGGVIAEIHIGRAALVKHMELGVQLKEVVLLVNTSGILLFASRLEDRLIWVDMPARRFGQGKSDFLNSFEVINSWSAVGMKLFAFKSNGDLLKIGFRVETLNNKTGAEKSSPNNETISFQDFPPIAFSHFKLKNPTSLLLQNFIQRVRFLRVIGSYRQDEKLREKWSFLVDDFWRISSLNPYVSSIFQTNSLEFEVAKELLHGLLIFEMSELACKVFLDVLEPLKDSESWILTCLTLSQKYKNSLLLKTIVQYQHEISHEPVKLALSLLQDLKEDIVDKLLLAYPMITPWCVLCLTNSQISSATLKYFTKILQVDDRMEHISSSLVVEILEKAFSLSLDLGSSISEILWHRPRELPSWKSRDFTWLLEQELLEFLSAIPKNISQQSEIFALCWRRGFFRGLFELKLSHPAQTLCCIQAACAFDSPSLLRRVFRESPPSPPGHLFTLTLEILDELSSLGFPIIQLSTTDTARSLLAQDILRRAETLREAQMNLKAASEST